MDIFVCAVCVFFLILVLFYFKRSYNSNRGLIKQNNEIIADAPNKEESIRLLNEIRYRSEKLINYCINTDPTNPNVQLLQQRFNPHNIQETSIHDSSTSYTIDKGEEVHLCLRDKKNLQHHDINILMFVSIHELAHIMSSSYGHNNEFDSNFKFLLQKAVECGVYSPENYNEQSKEFCGLTVSSSPLFN